MKKLIGTFMALLGLSAAFLAGCKHTTTTPAAPQAPVATFTSTRTATVTSTRTMTASATMTRTASPTPTATATFTHTPTATATSTLTLTPTVTPTSTDSLTPTETATMTMTPTATLSPTPQNVQGMVLLGSALNYVGLAYSQITNSGASTFCGSLGLYPGSQVDGGIVVLCGGTTDVANGAANTAKLDLSNAYTDAASRTGGAILPTGDDLGGLTLYPGLYTDGGNLSISSADLTLDALGDVNAVFIFQVSGVLDVTSGRQVLLSGGAKADRVFWQVSDYCSLGTTVSMVGNILAYNSVTLNTGAFLEGRAFGSNGNVTLLANTITKPAP